MYNEYSKKTKGSYIYYGLNGGVNSRYNPEYIQSSINYLYSPHKYGYNFMGWYLDPDFEQKVYSVDYEVGDCVKFLNDSFRDFIGFVEEIDMETHKVKVSVSMFGRDTEIELGFDEIEKDED